MLGDTTTYREMMRMSHSSFKVLLNFIEPYISPVESFCGNKVIKSPERLALTIRFLATGESFHSLSYQFRISRNAISYVVKQVAEANIAHVGPHFLRTPETQQEWLEIAEHFQTRWQFPHALGAIDGKHIIIKLPTNSGSHYYNYKKSTSIVLLAIAGPDYECLYADVGSNGRMNDSGMLICCV